MVQKMLLVLVCLILSGTSVEASERACLETASAFDHRIQFLKEHQVRLKNIQTEFYRKMIRAKGDYKALKGAHIASDVFMTISAVASLVAGGHAIAAVYFKGGTISVLGMTVGSSNIVTHLYVGYTMTSNSYFLIDSVAGYFGEDKTPEQVLEEEMNRMQKEEFLSTAAVDFVFNKRWSGSSELLESPLLEKSIDKLDMYYKNEIKKIGDRDNWWSYIGEFWHEKGLKRAALDVAVFNEAYKIQTMRMSYFDILIKLLSERKKICSHNFNLY